MPLAGRWIDNWQPPALSSILRFDLIAPVGGLPWSFRSAAFFVLCGLLTAFESFFDVLKYLASIIEYSNLTSQSI